MVVNIVKLLDFFDSVLVADSFLLLLEVCFVFLQLEVFFSLQTLKFQSVFLLIVICLLVRSLNLFVVSSLLFFSAV